MLPWQHWRIFGYPLWIWWLHSDYMNILFMWNHDTKVDEVYPAALIKQNLEIPSFCVPSVWVITTHQHTDIMTWNNANNTGKIIISNMKYLKLLRIYLSAINIEISVKFPSVWLCQVFHRSRGKSYCNTRTIGKLLCLRSNALNFIYFVSFYAMSCVSYAIHYRELVPHSFDLFWTTLHKYVPYRSVRWCCVALHTQV